jgi:DNA mismatch repair protein MutL
MRDLFFNLPVRKTVLKKPQYEAALVSDTVGRMIMGNPKVSFRFISNDRVVYHSFGDGELRHAIFAVYGRETAENLVEIDSYQGGMRIFGMIGIGEQAKSTRAHEAFFINGRSVRCPMLSQALESACRERVTIGMYPMCALNLVLPPTSVDVNVHPNKLEVRFRDEAATRLTAEAMLRTAFEGEGMLRRTPERQAEVRPVRTVEVVEPPVAEQQQINLIQTEVPDKQTEVEIIQTEAFNIQTEVVNNNSDSLGPEESLQSLLDAERKKLRLAGLAGAAALHERLLPVTAPRPAGEEIPQTEPVAEPKIQSATGAQAAPNPAPAPYRVIGTLFHTYILLEWSDALLMIDQHAAHERLRYEQLSKAVQEGAASQRLLAPEILRVTAREMALVEENMDALSAVGYDISPFGERDVQIRAVPHILGRAELKPRFMETIEALAGMGSAALEARREEILQRACKGAVKAGDALSDSEIKSLLRQMQDSGAPPTCPHGRPVARTLTRREIERMFKRIQ